MQKITAILLIVACLCDPIRAEKAADESAALVASFSARDIAPVGLAWSRLVASRVSVLPEEIRHGLLDIVADAEGRIWAAQKQGAELQVLENANWRSVKPKGLPANLIAKAITKLKDGSIACLWKDTSAPKLYQVSWHTGAKNTLPVKVEMELREPRLLPLEDDGLLITHEGREVLRISKDGADTETLVLPERLLVSPDSKPGSSNDAEYAMLHAVEHEGALWFWNPALREPVHRWRLRGLVKCKGSSFSLVDLKMPDKYRAISAVTPREGKLTIAVAGLLVMDYIEGREDQTGFSGHEDLQFIEQFFKAGDTWHFLSVPRPDLVEIEPSGGINNQLMVKRERYYDPEKQTSVLVAMVKNQEGGITLRRRTVKLDSEPFFGWSDRPVLATADGFWCGTRDGAMFFPNESKAEPIVLGGRQVVRMIQVDENHMLMLSENGDATLRPLKAVKEESSTVARIEKMKTGSFLVDDGAGRVLGRLPDGSFCRWDQDGTRQPLEVPENVLALRTNMLANDGAGQTWLWPREGGPAAVLDQTSGKWEVFQDPRKALETRMRAGSKLQIHDWPGYAPFASAAKPQQIAFLRMDGSLHLFDGGQWQSWQANQIGGADAKATGGPFFNAKGLLTLSLGFMDHQLTDGKRWEEIGSSDIENLRLNNTDDPQPPEVCPVEPHRVTCTAYDRHGVCWMRDYDSRLWKCFQGAAAVFLEPGSADDPLHGESCRIYETQVTDSGHAFLRIGLSWDSDEDYLCVRPRFPAPVSEAKLAQVSADTATISLGKAEWHVWRVDGGKWSLATKEREAVLAGLDPGQHEIEVLAVNAEITPAPKSAKLLCKISKTAPQNSKNQ